MKKLLPIIFTLLLFYFFTFSSPVYAQECSATACDPANSGFSRVSRPVPCEACCETDKLAESCADTFSVVDSVSYSDPCDCDIPPCEGNCYTKQSWGGTVTIDMCDTTAPFVGKSEQEDEQKYLADYFDGTGFYYTPPYDLTKLEDIIRTFLEGGVWRKLAPEKNQDDLKREMIQRAIDSLAGTIDSEKRIHNYIVEYKGEWKYLADIVPKPEDLEALKAWKKTIDYRLWPAVPMFSREDTIGYLIPWAGLNPEDYFSAQGVPIPLEVPHLARLFETTRKVNEILLPPIFQEEEQTKAKTLLASAKENVLGEKTLLAQAGNSLSVDFNISLSLKGGNQYDLCWTINPHATGDCNYAKWGYGIAPYGFLEPRLDGKSNWWNQNPTITCHDGSAHPIEINANPGDTVCATLVITGGQCMGSCCDPDPRPGLTKTDCCQILADGTPDCPGGLPPAPTCCLPPPAAVAQCDRSGIEDINPNDTICGPPLKAELRAVDCFECSDCPGASPSACITRTRGVSRDIEVNLELPFLEEIWEYTTEALATKVLAGVFNIFRPDFYPEFADIDAKSQIKYEYDSGEAIPSTGNFYYPHLGGIQKAKEWVIETLTSAYSTYESQ